MLLKFIEEWLEKLGEQNKKSFGTSRLDCCDLNKTNNVSNKVNNKDKYKK